MRTQVRPEVSNLLHFYIFNREEGEKKVYYRLGEDMRLEMVILDDSEYVVSSLNRFWIEGKKQTWAFKMLKPSRRIGLELNVVGQV